METPSAMTISDNSRQPITENLVDVIASFHNHDIRPLYFRITDEDGLRHEYRVERILTHKQGNYYGDSNICYVCEYKITDGVMRQIMLVYNVRGHAWTINK